MNKKLFIIFNMIMIILLTGCNKTEDSDMKFYGNVDVRTVSLAFRVPGRIQNINFQEGQKVKKGDPIVSIDDSLYKEYLNQITSQINMQKARLKKLEKGYRKEDIAKAKATMLQKQIVMENEKQNLERYKKLLATNSTSQEHYDNIKTTYQSANAVYLYSKSSLELLENGYEKEDIAVAKAQLNFLISQKNQHQINLNDTTIYAPSSGVILTRVYEVGSIVNSSQVVVEMTKDDKYWVRSYISERYLGSIKTGMKALIYTDNDKTKAYEGIVSFISPIAEFTPKNVQTEDLRTDLVYRFRINLNTYDDMIKQGMPVTIKFPDLKIK